MALEDDILANLGDPDKVLELMLSPLRDLEEVVEVIDDLERATRELKKGKQLQRDLELAAEGFFEIGAVFDEGAARQAAAQRATATS